MERGQSKRWMSDLSNQDDAALIRAVADRDKQAFAEVFSRYAGRVKGYLMRGGAAEADADELAQEVLLTVWRKAVQFDPGKAALSTWIFTIARNRRIDLIRRHKRAEPDPEDPLFQPDPDPDGPEVVNAGQIAERMREVLATLPEAQREVLVLAFFDGLTQSETAERLGIPLGTVKSRIRLAFKAMRQYLGEEMTEAFRDD